MKVQSFQRLCSTRCFAPTRALPYVEPSHHLAGSSSSSCSQVRHNMGLPGHALRLALPSARPSRLTLLQIFHGRLDGPGSALEAAEAIRKFAPRQVLVELCPARYSEVMASAVYGFPMQPPSRLNLLGSIHGGLMAHEFVPILQAARSVGASIVPVDRSRPATENRVAQRLWHPRHLQGLLRYGTSSRKQQQVSASLGQGERLRDEMKEFSPPAFDVLIEERSRYMAHQVQASAIPAAEVFLVCSALHSTSISNLLQRGEALRENLAELAHRSVPLWPLYVAGYGIIPLLLIGVGVASVYEVLLAPLLGAEE
mmetsp:Transcript_32784/g.59938  ORF Transcript_32784/g.59938 Transcript_32784/m.59938 type:complete len:312 (+) Transcript_32784:74-1009(+)